MRSKQNNNLFFSKLAFEQASINLGSTGLNPSVGCVVVKNDSVVSSARTSINGRPHAEHNALLDQGINFKNSILYVSMEPCVHYGKTSPCVNKIIKKKIKKVFFSINDVDERTSGKAKKILEKKNIFVKQGLLKKYGTKFYKSYFLKSKKSLPFIDAKIAISHDYFTKDKKTKWITNFNSRKIVHLLRSQYDCIISTSKSINDDNSLLNCRIDGLENRSPSIVIIDRNFKLKKKSKIITNKNKKKIYLFTTINDKIKQNYFKKHGVKVYTLDKMNTFQDYKKIFDILKKKGFSRFLVEAGLSFLNFLLDKKIVYNLYIFKTNRKLKQNGKNNRSNLFLKKIILKKKDRIKVNLFGDKLYKVALK
jgi:diaminohydroxyphosphoribosylaminopyrimidine deaminase / 5-amino-6-(5-phosphoribosylamino)uracil reductase